MTLKTNHDRHIALDDVFSIEMYDPCGVRPGPNEYPNCHEIRIYFDLIDKSAGTTDRAFGQLIYTDKAKCLRDFRKLRELAIRL